MLQGRLPSDLITALRNTFLNDPMSDTSYEPGPHDFDWAALGAAVGGLHRTVPGVSCLLGPLESQVSSSRGPSTLCGGVVVPQNTCRHKQSAWAHLDCTQAVWLPVVEPLSGQ
jgi:hypothetical protein